MPPYWDYDYELGTPPIERWVSIFEARGGERIIFDQRPGLGLYEHIEKLAQENQLEGDFIAVSRQMPKGLQPPQILTPFKAKPGPIECTFV